MADSLSFNSPLSGNKGVQGTSSVRSAAVSNSVSPVSLGATGNGDVVSFSGLTAAPGKDTPGTVNAGSLIANISSMSLDQARGMLSPDVAARMSTTNHPEAAFV